MPLLGLEAQLPPYDAPDPMRRDLALEIFAVLFDKPAGDLFDGNTAAVAHALQFLDDFQHLGLHVHAAL